MKSIIQLKTTAAPLLITVALLCFGPSPKAYAVIPAPDGGYPGENTAEGQSALLSLTTGAANTAVGWLSLASITTTNFNTGVGAGTLVLNTEGDENTATGAGALLNNTLGFSNTANGAFALVSNTEGANNTAVGDRALFNNVASVANTAVGTNALLNNVSGTSNTAVGFNSLLASVNNENTAVGVGALQQSTGSTNTALGAFAGSALAAGDDNIDIGNPGLPADSATIRIGSDQTSTFVAGISGATVPGGVAVVIDAGGHLGTTVSSARFKDEIKPMNKASEAILALKPVTFCYKKELDPNGMLQFGLVAEEVEKVNPDLVVRDKNGKPYSVRYDQVNAMLLNEFLKEHKAFLEEQGKVQKLEAALQAVNERLKEQEAKIERVSGQIEMSKAASQVALKNQ